MIPTPLHHRKHESRVSTPGFLLRQAVALWYYRVKETKPMPTNESANDAGARALQKKILEGRAFAREMAARLNDNLRNDVDTDRRIQPEPSTAFEDAFLSRMRQADQS
jgi:hypothetical protein